MSGCLGTGSILTPRMRRQKPISATSSSTSAVSVSLVPQPAGSSTAVPLAPSASQASARSGSVVRTFTSPTACERQSPSSSAHNSGGDLTSVRETSTVVIAGPFLPGLRESFRAGAALRDWELGTGNSRPSGLVVLAELLAHDAAHLADRGVLLEGGA